eukprot:6010451-Pyramimonas_sp.AAC.1
MVVLLRLAPYIPYNLLNYGLSLTAIPFSSYFTVSALAIIPGVCLYVYLGSLAKNIGEAVSKDGDNSVYCEHARIGGAHNPNRTTWPRQLSSFCYIPNMPMAMLCYAWTDVAISASVSGVIVVLVVFLTIRYVRRALRRELDETKKGEENQEANSEELPSVDLLGAPKSPTTRRHTFERSDLS